MLRTILIDDEADNLEVMQMLLMTYCPTVKVEAMCSSAMEGIEAIRQHKPDVIFLDIEMPNMNGFDMLEKIGDIDFEIVFVTAYHQFAIKAFQYSALDYLLKPVEPDELMDTVKRIEQQKTPPLKEQIELMMQSLSKPEQQTITRVALTTSYGLLFVLTKDIIYCGSDDNYTTVKLRTGDKILVSKTLKELDDMLSGPEFFRIHNSFLVNLSHISRYVKSDGGHVVMDDQTEIPISRSKKQDFIELFEKF